tara:strand:- start:38434 stop:39075 length:642 start_codon:yes stop_codon:yes gene_type:complete
VLSQYASIAPDQWCFSRSANGKPQIANAASKLAFNASDSGDYLACAVTRSAAVGVDLEYCATKRDVLRLAQRFFHPMEVARLESLSVADRQHAFHDYWTLKEAHIKALGATLGAALENTAFDLQYGAQKEDVGRVAQVSRVRSESVYFVLEPMPDYRLAVCAISPATGWRLSMFEQDQAGRVKALQPRLIALSEGAVSRSPRPSPRSRSASPR